MIDWISVEDRLPDSGQTVIGLTKTGVFFKGTYWRENEPLNMEYWHPYNPPVKKRWMPKEGGKVYSLYAGGAIMWDYWRGDNPEFKYRHEFLGSFKDQTAAEAMRDKIREFVTATIGVV